MSLEKLSYNLEDCISSWWMYPLAIRHTGYRNKTYLGYTDSQGYSGVASIDNRTNQVVKRRLKKADIDDHNAVAVEIMDDGRILCVYHTGHNIDNYMHVRISSKMESIEEFDDEILIEADGPTTYAQLHKKNGKYYVFFRTNNKNWSYTWSTDGKNWSKPVIIINAGMQYYLKVVDTTDRDMLRLVMYSNPNATDYNIRVGFFDTSTNELKLKDGTILGFSGIKKDLFSIILPTEKNKKQRLLDVATTDMNSTIIAYATFTDIETANRVRTDVKYKIAYHRDTLRTVEIVDGGKPFYYHSAYVGGMVFGYNEDTILLSRQDNGIWYIEEWQTQDTKTWEMVELIHRSDKDSVAIRPIIEKDGDKVIWQEGLYDNDTYTTFNVDLHYSILKKR